MGDGSDHLVVRAHGHPARRPGTRPRGARRGRPRLLLRLRPLLGRPEHPRVHLPHRAVPDGGARATAVGIATAISRIGAAVGSYLLPIGLDRIGVGTTMLIMAAITLLGFVVCVTLAPETRGRRLAEASGVTSTEPEAAVQPAASTVR
ncbi:MFS transporter [Streptomyces botrytidirepellens]|uniref:MFS transporter n=1 Tax=Streptomyces botrytidirepellens TaxID=2486417 RepID=UPI001FEC3D0C|nr:MFS transporter [Streptomyces botrytidirepellens]